jgi:hypothetical protein
MSPTNRLVLAALILGAVCATLPNLAADAAVPSAADCENGAMIDGENCCREVVVSSRCRWVPETKTVKKTVYSYKNVPYCQPNCPNPLHRCGAAEKCTECECCPRYKRVLVKREVVEKVETWKCVVEEEKQQVPSPASRHVPAAQAPGQPGDAPTR